MLQARIKAEGEETAAFLPAARHSLALLVAGLFAAFFFAQFHLSHDNSWYLIATRRFMDGATLYVDIIELNPPLAFYLTVPGLAFADWPGLSDKAGYVAYVAALATISNLWAASLVQRSTLERRAKVALWVAAPLITLLLPISEFGQREHLLIAFTLPYLFAFALREELRLGRGEQVALGAFAVLGFALKPYFYLAAAAVTLAACFRDRSIKPVFSLANLTIAAATFAYLAFIFGWHPEYVEEIVPLATSVYHSYGFPIWKRIFQPAFSALPALAMLWLAQRGRDDAVAIYLSAIALGFVVSYFVQFKGWNYQILPSAAYLFTATLWLAMANLDAVRTRLPLAVALIVATLGTIGQQVIRGPYQSVTARDFSIFVEKPQTPILVLSSNLSAGFPFVNEVDGIWASRLPAQWLIPGALSAKADLNCEAEVESCMRLDAVLEQSRQLIIDDMRNYQPELVYIDEREEKDYFKTDGFEYLDFMNENPAFSTLWAQYERAGTAYNYRVWRLKGAADE